MKQNKLISLALNFASFLVDRTMVNSIILFGSVASNNFDKESDIDIFIDYFIDSFKEPAKEEKKEIIN